MAEPRVEQSQVLDIADAAGARVFVSELASSVMRAAEWGNLTEQIALSGATELLESISRTHNSYLIADEERRALTVEAYLRVAFAENSDLVVIAGAALGEQEREIIDRYSARLSVVFVAAHPGERDRVALMSPFQNIEDALAPSTASLTFSPRFDADTDVPELTVAPDFDLEAHTLAALKINGAVIDLQTRANSDVAFIDVVSSTGPSEAAASPPIEAWRGYWLYPKIDQSAEDLRTLLDDLARVDDAADLALDFSDRVKRDLFSPRELHAFDQALDAAGRPSASRVEAIVLPESIPSAEAVAYECLRKILGQVQSAILNAEAEQDSIRAKALEGVWDDVSARLRSLAGNVPPGLVRYEDRAEASDESQLGVRTHTVFNAVLTSYSNERIAQAFQRQSRMLAVLNRLMPTKLRLVYRILTTRGTSGGLRPVVQVRCLVDDASAVDAAALRPSVGELIHATFVGIYGLSFSFDGPEAVNASEQLQWRSGRHTATLHFGDGERLISGFPDWAYVVDYLCSLDAPTAIELSVRAGTGSSSEWATETLVPLPANELDVAIEASGVSQQRVGLQIAVSSDEPLSRSLLHLIEVETLGARPGEFREGESEWIETTIGQALRVFHPPFGNWFTGSTVPPSFRKIAPLSDFPPNGMPFGRAKVAHPKGTQDVEVRVPDVDRLRHAYIIGRTGSGKTNLLRGMTSHELRSPSTGLAVIDPHGDLASHVLNSLPLARRNEMQVMNFEDPDVIPVLNPLLGIGDDELRKSQVVQEVLALLKGRIYHEFSGPRFDAIVRLVVDTMLDPGYPFTPSLIDASVLLTDERLQARVRNSLQSGELRARWDSHVKLKDGRDYPDLMSWVVSKFDDLRHDSTLRLFLGGDKNTVDLERLASDNGVLVVSIPEAVVGAQTAEFIGSLVLMKLRHALMAPGRRQGESNPFFVYVDEFQKFAGAGFESFLSEARKFGVGLVMAHQNIEQLRAFSANTGAASSALIDSILGNVGTLAVFPVNSADAQRLASQLDVEPVDLVRLARFECLIRPTVSGIALPAFTLTVPYTQPALDPRRLDATREYLIQQSLVRRRADVQAEVDDREKSMLANRPALHAAKKLSDQKSSFLDEWLEKRERLASQKVGTPSPTGTFTSEDVASVVPSSVALRRAKRVPPTSWTEVIGPVATAVDVANHLGVSLEQLVSQSDRGEILLLETSDGVTALPVAHLLDRGIVPGLEEVTRAISRSPFTRWTQAAWLASPSSALGSKSPIEWLREGGDTGLVLSVAEAYSEEEW